MNRARRSPPKIALLAFLFALPSLASGLIKVAGKLVSITDKDYIVQTEAGTFAVTKAYVAKDVAAAIDRPETSVELEVPFAALKKAKPLRQ